MLAWSHHHKRALFEILDQPPQSIHLIRSHRFKLHAECTSSSPTHDGSFDMKGPA